MEEADGCMAVTDVDATGQRYVKSWIDDTHDPPTADEYDEVLPSRESPASATALPVFGTRPMCSREAPSLDQREGLTPGYDVV